jgi:hypothetical protein
MSDTIRNLVRAYASAVAGANMAGTNGAFEKHMDESERIMQQILSYYQPRPEGSVTVTQAEYDALLAIYMAAESFITNGITSQTIHDLEQATEKYSEILAEGE